MTRFLARFAAYFSYSQLIISTGDPDAFQVPLIPDTARPWPQWIASGNAVFVAMPYQQGEAVVSLWIAESLRDVCAHDCAYTRFTIAVTHERLRFSCPEDSTIDCEFPVPDGTYECVAFTRTIYEDDVHPKISFDLWLVPREPSSTPLPTEGPTWVPGVR